MLGEKVGWRRWLAVIIGFAGTLIIIRPGFKELNPGVFLALASGVALSIYMMLTKKIAGRAPAIVTNFQTNFLGAHHIVLHRAVCLAMAKRHAMAAHDRRRHHRDDTAISWSIKAFDHADASLLAPLAYTEMITAVLGGWYFFGDFPGSLDIRRRCHPHRLRRLHFLARTHAEVRHQE